MAQATAILTFMRHGEKDDDGKITETGTVQARSAGIKANSLHGDIMLFHSGIDRVRQTIRHMAATLNLDEETEENIQLGEGIVDYISPNLQYLIDPIKKGEYFQHWDDIEMTTPNIAKRMDDFLAYGSESPEPKYCYSPRQMAQNIAIMIGTQVRFANLTDLSTVVNFVNGSHEPVLMAFIHYFINNYQPDGVSTIEKVGGTSIDFAEAFEVRVYHQSPTDFNVEFRFRDIVKEFDLEELRDFGYGKSSQLNRPFTSRHE